MVERLPSKQTVVGSIPIARSMRIKKVIIETEGDVHGSAYPLTAEFTGCGHGYNVNVRYTVNMETGEVLADITDLAGLAIIDRKEWERHLIDVAERCKRLVNQ